MIGSSKHGERKWENAGNPFFRPFACFAFRRVQGVEFVHGGLGRTVETVVQKIVIEEGRETAKSFRPSLEAMEGRLKLR